jgi:hypothetical protein
MEPFELSLPVSAETLTEGIYEMAEEGLDQLGARVEWFVRFFRPQEIN